MRAPIIRGPAVAALLAGTGLACGSAAGEHSGGGADPPSAPLGVYALAEIGGAGPPFIVAETVEGCRQEIDSETYRLDADGRWTWSQTLRETCPPGRGAGGMERPTNGGTYSLHGDTIRFFAAERGADARLVSAGLLRGDTLREWGAEEEGGDRLYLREGG